MTTLLATAAPPASGLLDVFEKYDGETLFGGLAAGAGGPGILGRIGWIFTAFGAFFVLWGFVLRSRGAGGGDKVGEIARTWVIIGFMMAGPFLMRTGMEAADGVYESAAGGPRQLAFACVKAAYAMPEVTSLFEAVKPNAAAAQSESGLLRYLKAVGSAAWNSAVGNATGAVGTWTGLVRVFSLLSGLGSAVIKCLLILVTFLPLYFLLLASGALVWFLCQVRFFLAVVGTMMLPLFAGMFSLPAGHANRQAAQAYVMHMISIALWPVAWAIGHTGTIALYNALVSVIAGTSRVPDLVAALQWDSIISGASISPAQLRSMETALGNWFMGNMTALLGVLVGGIGFAGWVFIVSILGPVFLHRLLSTGATFMTQALESAGRSATEAGKIGMGAAKERWVAQRGPRGPEASPEGAVSKKPLTFGLPFDSPWPGPSGGPKRANLREAARRIGRG